MIFDSVSNLMKYAGMLERLAEVNKFINSQDCVALPKGRYELNHGIYVNVDHYAPRKNLIFEAHRRYIDVQYIAEGDEIIYFLPIGDGTGSTGYQEDKDIEFFEPDPDNAGMIQLKAGQFAIFLPEDLHAPVNPFKSEFNKKLVFKIPCKV